MPRIHVAPNGRLWCRAGGRYHKNGVKETYLTIDDAWREAFRQFVLRGAIMTPYRCTSINLIVPVLYHAPHPNPWAFRAMLTKVYAHTMKRRSVCGAFHLTMKRRDLYLRP